MEHDWPPHFPENCPPEEAAPPNQRVYRLVKNTPPRSSDFVSYALEYQGRWRGRELCEACGLSAFSDLHGCRRAERRIPALKGMLPAQATLSETHGRIAATPRSRSSSHLTWWLPTSLTEPELLFTVLG